MGYDDGRTAATSHGGHMKKLAYPFRWITTYLSTWVESFFRDFLSHHEFAKWSADLATRNRLEP